MPGVFPSCKLARKSDVHGSASSSDHLRRMWVFTMSDPPTCLTLMLCNSFLTSSELVNFTPDAWRIHRSCEDFIRLKYSLFFYSMGSRAVCFVQVAFLPSLYSGGIVSRLLYCSLLQVATRALFLFSSFLYIWFLWLTSPLLLVIACLLAVCKRSLLYWFRWGFYQSCSAYLWNSKIQTKADFQVLCISMLRVLNNVQLKSQRYSWNIIDHLVSFCAEKILPFCQTGFPQWFPVSVPSVSYGVIWHYAEVLYGQPQSGEDSKIARGAHMPWVATLHTRYLRM